MKTLYAIAVCLFGLFAPLLGCAPEADLAEDAATEPEPEEGVVGGSLFGAGGTDDMFCKLGWMNDPGLGVCYKTSGGPCPAYGGNTPPGEELMLTFKAHQSGLGSGWPTGTTVVCQCPSGYTKNGYGYCLHSYNHTGTNYTSCPTGWQEIARGTCGIDPGAFWIDPGTPPASFTSDVSDNTRVYFTATGAIVVRMTGHTITRVTGTFTCGGTLGFSPTSGGGCARADQVYASIPAPDTDTSWFVYSWDN